MNLLGEQNRPESRLEIFTRIADCGYRTKNPKLIRGWDFYHINHVSFRFLFHYPYGPIESLYFPLYYYITPIMISEWFLK